MTTTYTMVDRVDILTGKEIGVIVVPAMPWIPEEEQHPKARPNSSWSSIKAVHIICRDSGEVVVAGWYNTDEGKWYIMTNEEGATITRWAEPEAVYTDRGEV